MKGSFNMGSIVRMNIRDRFEKAKTDWIKEKIDNGTPIIFISGGLVESVYGDNVAVVDIDSIEDTEHEKESDAYDEAIQEF